MVGRKCGVPPTVVVDAIMSFKDDMVSIDEKGDMSEYHATMQVNNTFFHYDSSNTATLKKYLLIYHQS